MFTPPLLSSWSDLRAGFERSPEELETLQLKRLQALAHFAYQNVPYYRTLFDSVGFQPRHLKRLSDLRAIPITTRERLQAARVEDLIARGYSAATLMQTRTSASTGAPLTVYKSRLESWTALPFRWRIWRYHGIRFNERILTINGRPSTAAPASTRFRLAPARVNLSIFESPQAILDALLRFRPTVLYGYAFHVAQAARLAREKGLCDWDLRLVATSGTMLVLPDRKVVQEVFACDPIDIYSSSELGDIGWQCRRRDGFHLNADRVYVEFLRDGRPVEDGERGEVVVTQLYRYSMPLIRYRLGDVAVPRQAPCACGIRLPMMERLEGRTLNVVPLPNGRWFIGFLVIMAEFPEVEKFQVVQKALDEFQISVVPGRDYSPVVAERIAATVRSRVGADIRVEVKPVAANELIQVSGKAEPVIPFARVDFGNR